MFGFGVWELVIVLVIVLVLFSRKLPEIGEGLGKGIRSFRKSIKQPDEIDVTPDNEDESTDKDKKKSS
ncbi:MAG: twin-arginine translocase TatA/TatE family subunit [Deltaproteobacteria bacterium]|nr:twin-arginine translocase TatA/TatE family subunit [Deltaproteobacteria bacterium]